MPGTCKFFDICIILAIVERRFLVEKQLGTNCLKDVARGGVQKDKEHVRWKLIDNFMKKEEEQHA
jgi:hypothetical protein